MTGIAARRLHAQHLIGAPLASAVDAVGWLGAVQAQDYGAAKWALGQRVAGATDAGLDRLVDQGAILRTHVLRPTWHFVLPADIRWLLALTGPRIRRALTGRYRQLELDEATVARGHAVIAAAVAGGNHRIRAELGDALRAAGIPPDGQRVAHLIMGAELSGLIVSGPRRGRQVTYALLDERVPATAALDRAEAVSELAWRYFRSHGPAQLQDFVWWSGLTMADARLGIAVAGDALERQSLGGKDYWFDAAASPPPSAAQVAHLLPNFDEYTVAYRDRAAVLRDGIPIDAGLLSFGSVIANIVTIGGTVRGTWRRVATARAARLEIRSWSRLNPPATAAVEKVARHLSRFHERPLDVAWL